MAVHVGGRGPGHMSRRAPTGTVAFDSATTAALAAMSVQPDATRQTAYNTLIAGLKSDGVWAKLDWLSVFAAHDSQAALLNLVNPAQTMTAVSAPTFTTDRGFTGDGAASYLNSGWNPATATSPKYVLNDAHAGVWIGTTGASTTQSDLGNRSVQINSHYDTTRLNYYVHNTTLTLASGIASAVGHSVANRTASNSQQSYKNGSALGAASSTASVGIGNAPILIGANNNHTTGGVTPITFSARRQQAAHWGSQLSAGDITNLYNRLSTYMTAVGA